MTCFIQQHETIETTIEHFVLDSLSFFWKSFEFPVANFSELKKNPEDFQINSTYPRENLAFLSRLNYFPLESRNIHFKVAILVYLMNIEAKGLISTFDFMTFQIILTHKDEISAQIKQYERNLIKCIAFIYPDS